MLFRNDVNGLRAIAVLAVVIFHFDASLLPGGFAGVDVFFVISGFLMTNIIFNGFQQNKFSILQFYIARSTRIIPPLAFLCIVLMAVGWFILSPQDLKLLGKHSASSVGFISNFVFWHEAGYFDSSSKGKWLLHTWSLSVEWQFYVLYPLILMVLKSMFTLSTIKSIVLYSTIFLFGYSLYTSFIWPSASYFMLSARAWELLVGGLAFLYPLQLKQNHKSKVNLLGIFLIVTSYVFISEEHYWPGYLALLPVLGAFLVIQAKTTDSFIYNNVIFQKIGTWSYSIYLWHWPIAVAFFYFSISPLFDFLGISLSILLGYLSYFCIERRKFRTSAKSLIDCFKFKPLLMTLFVGMIGSSVFMTSGFKEQRPVEYKQLLANAAPNPFREKCHLEKYNDPKYGCEYFTDNITWAVFGDSHATELAYSLARTLENKGVGVKHLTFSGCAPSYKLNVPDNDCVRWYNQAVSYLLNTKNINNVVINHRFTRQLFGGDAFQYPEGAEQQVTQKVTDTLIKFDKMISDLAAKKENIYIIYPFPELNRSINHLVAIDYISDSDLSNINGTSRDWYELRNSSVIQHFESRDYPKNVHFINPVDIFCDDDFCFAVRDKTPLYFDSNHPSVVATDKVVELIQVK